MKHSVIIVMVVLFLASAVIPAYAATRQENNKNIAEFILDTMKLPYILIGAFVKQDHQKVKEDLDYKEHKGLMKCIRKSD